MEENVNTLPVAVSQSFWNNSSLISSRSREKGLQYAFEAYIHNIKIKKEGNTTVIEGNAYRSQAKNEKPHNLFLKFDQERLLDQSCSCTAGYSDELVGVRDPGSEKRVVGGSQLSVGDSQLSFAKAPGYCSHVVGLMFTLDYGRATKENIPDPFHGNEEPISCTSLPQQWHKPRGKKILSEPVINLVVAKALVNRKRKPIMSSYTHNKKVLGSETFNLLREMTDSPISYISTETQHHVDVGGTKYPLGCGLSHQLPLITVPTADGGAPQHRDEEDFPKFTLPPQPTNVCTVLNENAMQIYTKMTISLQDSIKLEHNTRKQNSTNLWFDERSNRLTSSTFKRICCRKADHDILAVQLKSKESVKTKAMRRGIEQEPVAAAEYTTLTGNPVYPCGLVVNPHAPHLGTSPDRKVREIKGESTSYGLLEIKCPSKDSITLCPYIFKKADGSYKLKESHEYYYQIMGQLGLTGMSWCDLFVKSLEDHHLEIYFDAVKWEQMKNKLDAFYFDYYINQPCQ